MPPPLPPGALGFPLTTAGGAVVVELFLDLICPFSAKMFCTRFDGGVLEQYGQTVSFVLHQVPQPWHPQGSWVHEAVLAASEVCPDKYPAYVRAVYKAFLEGSFTDAATWDSTRADVYDELLKLAKAVGGIDTAKMRKLLTLQEGGANSGTKCTQAIKWAVKFHRVRAVHVTPTVFVNGLEAGVVSSGWSADEWLKFLEGGCSGADAFQGSLLSS